MKMAALLTTELAPSPALYAAAFDRVWETLRGLYYSTGSSADSVATAREKHQPRAAQAKNDAEFERRLTRMVAEQPLIKPVVTSSGAVVVSGHPLASEAGRLALEKGGNIVDAAVAVSFALGCGRARSFGHRR